jgi:hypothetical protein
MTGNENMLRNILVRGTEKEAFRNQFLGGVDFHFDDSREGYIL